MTSPERMDADFRGTGPLRQTPRRISQVRANKSGASAIDIGKLGTDRGARSGWVTFDNDQNRERICVLNSDDETGVSNVIITPQLFDKPLSSGSRPSISSNRWHLQNQTMGFVKGGRVQPSGAKKLLHHRMTY